MKDIFYLSNTSKYTAFVDFTCIKAQGSDIPPSQTALCLTGIEVAVLNSRDMALVEKKQWYVKPDVENIKESWYTDSVTSYEDSMKGISIEKALSELNNICRLYRITAVYTWGKTHTGNLIEAINSRNIKLSFMFVTIKQGISLLLRNTSNGMNIGTVKRMREYLGLELTTAETLDDKVMQYVELLSSVKKICIANNVHYRGKCALFLNILCDNAVNAIEHGEFPNVIRISGVITDRYFHTVHEFDYWIAGNKHNYIANGTYSGFINATRCMKKSHYTVKKALEAVIKETTDYMLDNTKLNVVIYGSTQTNALKQVMKANHLKFPMVVKYVNLRRLYTRKTSRYEHPETLSKISLMSAIKKCGLSNEIIDIYDTATRVSMTVKIAKLVFSNLHSLTGYDVMLKEEYVPCLHENNA